MYAGTGCKFSDTASFEPQDGIQVIQVTQDEFWKMVNQDKISCGCSIDLAARAVMQGILDIEPFQITKQ